MNKNILSLLFLTSFIISVQAQNIRFNTYFGGAFDDKVNSYYNASNFYQGKINGGFLWGSGMEFRIRNNVGTELSYMHQDTKAPIEYYDHNSGTVKNTNFHLGFNYILIGAIRSLNVSRKIEPYAGLMAGIAMINATNPGNENSDVIGKFAWGLRCGTNIWVSKIVGIKFQAQLLSVSQAIGGGFYVGTGGSGTTVSNYSSMYQFGMGAGIAFKLAPLIKTR